MTSASDEGHRKARMPWTISSQLGCLGRGSSPNPACCCLCCSPWIFNDVTRKDHWQIGRERPSYAKKEKSFLLLIPAMFPITLCLVSQWKKKCTDSTPKELLLDVCGLPVSVRSGALLKVLTRNVRASTHIQLATQQQLLMTVTKMLSVWMKKWI